MNERGGYTVHLEGRPTREVEVLPEPDALDIPLWSRRFRFTEVTVQEGQRVQPGDCLAKDPKNYSVPLLAPRGGVVRLKAKPEHVVIEQVVRQAEEEFHPDERALHVPRNLGRAGIKRYKLLALGAWQFFQDAHTERLPDPFSVPRTVLVSTVHYEPFVARGDVMLHKRLLNFTRGLEHLQSLLEYQPIYLVLPNVRSEFARKVRETLRGYAWVNLTDVPRRYGLEDYCVLARRLGLKYEKNNPVWAVGVDGVLAVDRALTMSKPATVRLISLGGPMVRQPRHLRAVSGYPLEKLMRGRLVDGEVRIIDGGVFTGSAWDSKQMGLNCECTGLTVLPRPAAREFLGFMRPGFGRRSHSRCFLSVVRGPFPERLTTALRGERRACVACGFCEEVCPAGLMPHLIHKALYQDALEEAERLGVEMCVACGLCSFVCPSKIELRGEFIEAVDRIESELRAEAQENAV